MSGLPEVVGDDHELRFDLGSGHSFVWFRNQDGIFGLIETHPHEVDDKHPRGTCSGYIAWVPGPHHVAKHQLVAGGEGNESSLTISPSLQCKHCPSHGYIQEGKWVEVP